MKKRMLSVLMAGMMVLSMTACGGNKAASSDGSSTGAAATTKAGGNTADANAESSWPSNTVSFYLPAKAGGGTDMLGRLFSQGMTEVNGGNYVIVNDTTGNGTVACETVRNSKPDGLNLLMYHTGLCANVASGLYDHTIDDFSMLGLFISLNETNCTAGLYVPADLPYDTFEELVAYAKENPGELISGVQNGSSSQFGQFLLEDACGFKTTQVEAGSNADKVTALMGGQIDMAILTHTGTTQYVESGALKCLVQYGIVGATEKTMLPDVPSLAEVNPEWDKNYIRVDLIGFIAGPKGMSDADIAEINNVIKGAVETETVQKGFEQMGAVVSYYTIDEATEIVKGVQEGYDRAAELMAAAK